jgi:hypothetical protein
VYGRAVRIAVSLGGFIARVARDAALGQLGARSAVRAAELRKLLSGLGPSFVKIGQALSARPDLLPQVSHGCGSSAAHSSCRDELRGLVVMVLMMTDQQVIALAAVDYKAGFARSTQQLQGLTHPVLALLVAVTAAHKLQLTLPLLPHRAAACSTMMRHTSHRCPAAFTSSTPQVYLEALSELQDRLPSFPNEIAWAVVEEELGVPVAEVYEQLSEQPVAAASLGQVGRGVVHAVTQLRTAVQQQQQHEQACGRTTYMDVYAGCAGGMQQSSGSSCSCQCAACDAM